MGKPNPMRHDCDRRGCYLETTHAPLEIFASAFDGQIAMSDIDGITERHGRFLVMEWKVLPGKVTVGQEILLKALSRSPNFQVCIITAPVDRSCIRTDTMVQVQRVRDGEIRSGHPYSVQEVIDTFSYWFKAVDRRPARE